MLAHRIATFTSLAIVVACSAANPDGTSGSASTGAGGFVAGGGNAPVGSGGGPLSGIGGAFAAGGNVATGGSPTSSGSGGTVAASGGSPASGAGGDGVGGGGGTAAGAGGAVATGAGGAADVDFDPQASDFECITRWTHVRNFYVTNKLGNLDGTLAIANDTTNGGKYPVGTIIQLVPFEAMVKRHAGFSADTNDWEFFSLNAAATGTQIVSRGTKNVVNQFGGNCFTCHQKADPKFDFVCEETHGCDPLPLTPQLIQAAQASDARCP
jgi:hypothetical protein